MTHQIKALKLLYLYKIKIAVGMFIRGKQVPETLPKIANISIYFQIFLLPSNVPAGKDLDLYVAIFMCAYSQL